MFKIVDTDTREPIARFSTEEYARAGGIALSRDYHRPLTILIESTKQPIARYLDGAEIPVMATLYRFPAKDTAAC